ncbi:hypothetical protein M0R45_036816 [Rubus argutus]|uniref:Uncharacterized protein n=1 Tax=Rubus argutus TaxID=59490 RepID=A0AAW1VXG3_RUBAR
MDNNNNINGSPPQAKIMDTLKRHLPFSDICCCHKSVGLSTENFSEDAYNGDQTLRSSVFWCATSPIRSRTVTVYAIASQSISNIGTTLITEHSQ